MPMEPAWQCLMPNRPTCCKESYTLSAVNSLTVIVDKAQTLICCGVWICCGLVQQVVQLVHNKSNQWRWAIDHTCHVCTLPWPPTRQVLSTLDRPLSLFISHLLMVGVPWQYVPCPQFGTKFQKEVPSVIFGDPVHIISLKHSMAQVEGRSYAKNQLSQCSHFNIHTYIH